ncbi:tripartite tricarboxylate transporter TctB family protein [Eubacteriales bacterium OttesenSCG-928-N13]|nr:tripartite tricarboxylate transporter TctB family protein [Eubacteriales bacterium OttesenSCG-928-N13]
MEKKKRSAAIDSVVGVLLAIFGIYVIVESLNMTVYNIFIDSPGFFPLIIGVILTILGAVLAVMGFKAGGAVELKEVFRGTFLKNFIKDDSTIRVIILLAFMAVYIYGLLGRIHFIIATSIYLCANFFYLKACKKWWMAIIISVIASVAVYYAFRYGFNITLP